MNLIAHSMLLWLLILVAMFGNGVLRVGVLQPRLGEDLARQVASLTGIAIVLGLSRSLVPRLGRRTASELVGVGAIWLALTLAFEFGFGRYVSGLSWQALFADYDLFRGRLWPLVLLATFAAPWFWGRVRAPQGGAA
jgi:hypothetical protein